MTLEYFCHCLNVHLRIPEGDLQEEQSEVFEESVERDPFFNDAFMVLAPQHFTVKQKLQCMCRSREVEGWTITSCINCRMDVYATSENNGNAMTIAVSSSVERDQSTIRLLSDLENYSPLYKVLVISPPTSNLSENEDLAAQESVHQQLEELKERTVQLLNAENERLLERIRNYENEQMSLFNELQTRVHTEQDILSQVLVNCHHEVFSNDRQLITPPDSSILSEQPQDVPLNSIVSDKPRRIPSSLPITSKQSDDTMFAMDEEEDDARHSESLQADDDISEESETRPHTQNGQSTDYDDDSDDAFATISTDVRMYATSMPITMPRAWQPSSQVIHTDDANVSPVLERTKKDDPKWIAASIQALAMSVRGNDGTEMFGARPRPRLNTLD